MMFKISCSSTSSQHNTKRNCKNFQIQHFLILLIVSSKRKETRCWFIYYICFQTTAIRWEILFLSFFSSNQFFLFFICMLRMNIKKNPHKSQIIIYANFLLSLFFHSFFFTGWIRKIFILKYNFLCALCVACQLMVEWKKKRKKEQGGVGVVEEKWETTKKLRSVSMEWMKIGKSAMREVFWHKRDSTLRRSFFIYSRYSAKFLQE
jgi:hypothetical protein